MGYNNGVGIVSKWTCKVN